MEIGIYTLATKMYWPACVIAYAKNAFGRNLSVFVFFWLLTFESVNLETSFLVRRLRTSSERQSQRQVTTGADPRGAKGTIPHTAAGQKIETPFRSKVGFITQWPKPVSIQLQISFYLNDTVQFLIGTNLALPSSVRHTTQFIKPKTLFLTFLYVNMQQLNCRIALRRH